MKSKGMRPKCKFNDLVDDIRKDTTRIHYPKRAAKQLQESFRQTEIDKQRADSQRQQYVWQGPWNHRQSTPTYVFSERKWQSERQSPYIASAVPHELMPEELTNPEDADMQCERQTYEPTYCYNMNVDPELDLHMAAQIQEERLEFQFHEFREELAEKSQRERQELMELRAQMHSKRLDDETKVNTRVQEHEKQEERQFQQLRQTLEEENKTSLLALRELRASSEPPAPSEEYAMRVRDVESEAEKAIQLNARFQEELREQQVHELRQRLADEDQLRSQEFHALRAHLHQRHQDETNVVGSEVVMLQQAERQFTERYEQGAWAIKLEEELLTQKSDMLTRQSIKMSRDRPRSRVTTPRKSPRTNTFVGRIPALPQPAVERSKSSAPLDDGSHQTRKKKCRTQGCRTRSASEGESGMLRAPSLMNVTLLREFLMTSANKDKLNQSDRSLVLQTLDAFREARGNRTQKAEQIEILRGIYARNFYNA